MRKNSKTNVKVTLSYGQAAITIEVNRHDNYYPTIEQTSRYPSLDYERANPLPYYDDDYKYNYDSCYDSNYRY